MRHQDNHGQGLKGKAEKLRPAKEAKEKELVCFGRQDRPKHRVVRRRTSRVLCGSTEIQGGGRGFKVCGLSVH